MRRNTLFDCANIAAASLLAASLDTAQPTATVQTPTAEAAAAARARLEQARATIRSIRIAVDNVFDPSKPDENKRLYRWANNVHVLTRETVIDDILLFEVGDVFAGRVLDESARLLRSRDFIADATIEPRDYDAATNSVAIEVRVRDSWSLAFDLSLNRKGGETEWGIGLSDSNLFGTGKTVEIGRESEIDRDQTTLGYADGNLFGTRVQLRALFADASDGQRHELGVERPFFALDTRWSAGGSIHDEQRIDTMYDLGEEIDEFRHELDTFELKGGWSRG